MLYRSRSHAQCTCTTSRLSVDTAFQQVKELENKVSGMEKRMVKAPEDMKTQMEKFFNASSYKLTHHSIP